MEGVALNRSSQAAGRGAVPPDNGDHSARTSEEIDDLLARLEAGGPVVVEAGWRDELRAFVLTLASGQRLIFRDCLQASFHRAPSAQPPWPIGGWWTDEPSPLLLSLDPQVRFLYRHLVLELGEGLLRIACQSIELHERRDGG